MFVRAFKTTYPIHYVFFIMMTLVYQIPDILRLFNGNFTLPADNSLIINLLTSVTPILTTIVTLAVLYASAIAIVTTSQHNLIITRTSSLPGAIFILLTAFKMLTPEIAASLTLILCIYKLLNSNNEEAYNELNFLSAGTMIGISIMISPYSIIYLLLIFYAMYELKNYNIRFLLLIIMGFLLPTSICALCYLTFGNINDMITMLIPDVRFDIILHHNELSICNTIHYLLYIILVSFSIAVVWYNKNSMSQIIEKEYKIITAAAVIPITLSFFIADHIALIMMSIIPSSFLISKALLSINKFWRDVIATIMIFLPILLLF